MLCSPVRLVVGLRSPRGRHQALRPILLAFALAWTLAAPAAAQNPNAHTPRKPSDAIEVNSQPLLDQSTPKEGDPVEPSTGNFMLEETDLSLPGRGLSLSFTRHYRSGSVVHSALGPKWDFNWNQYVTLEWHPNPNYEEPPIGGMMASGQSSGGWDPNPPYLITGAFYYNGSQRISMFDTTIGSLWSSPASTFAKLLEIKPNGGPFTPPDSFEIRNPDGTVLTFGIRDPVDPFIDGHCHIFRLTRIEDRQGNAITFSYESLPWHTKTFHRLTQVTDPYGQTLQFAYDPTTWLMTSVTDSFGRVVSFQHDGDYNLTDVTSPAVTGTPTPANDFPDGRTTHYTYHPTGGTESTSNLLFEAIAPQEWQNGSGSQTPYLRNYYETGTSRVVKQVFGGTNASWIPAGGTYAFLYESSLNGIDHGWFVEKTRTLTVDPNGNVRLAIFDENGSDRLSYQFKGRLNPETVTGTISGPGGLVDINVSSPSISDSIVAPLETLRQGDPGCYWTRRDYNADGLLEDETTAATHVHYTYDSASPDNFQKGNLVKFEEFAVGTSDPTLTTYYAYEPFFNQVRATIDPRGTFPGFVPPNGGTQSAARYMSKKLFDYQEGSNLYALTTGQDNMQSRWAIDIAQASQFSILPSGVLPPIDQEIGLADLNGDGDYHIGNVIVDRHPTAQVFGDPELGTWAGQDAEVTTAYNAFSLPTSVKDEEGHVTTFLYFPVNDPWGQTTPPGASGNGGALQSIQRPLGVSGSFTYDSMGRQNSATNGRGFTSSTLFNQLGEVVTVTDARGYSTRSMYDWNGNLIQTRITPKTPGIAGNGVPNGSEVAGAEIVDNFIYDILDNLVAVDSQLDGAVRGATHYRYDRNGNRVLTMMPERVNSPSNYEAELPDERGLTWQFTRGKLSAEFRSLYANAQIPELASLPDSSDATLVEKDYTLDGQLATLIDGMGHQTTYEYDGYQRLWKTTDPEGNYSQLAYDPNDFVVENFAFEFGGALLAHTQTGYDERGRVFQEDADLFISGSIGVTESDGPLTPSDGKVTSRYVFDKRGLTTKETDDNKTTVTTQYDALGRAVQESDELSNTTVYTYDLASNLITSVETEVVVGGSPVVTRTDYFYDQLDRQVAVLDNTNRTARFLYNSRGHLVCVTDAKSSNNSTPVDSLEVVPGEHVGISGVTNGHGNSTVHTYDDGGRSTKTVSYLTLGGVGTAARDLTQGGGDGKITILRTFDLNNRLTSIADDNGNLTVHHYDALNRLTSSDAADGTSASLQYDDDDMVIVSTDANGSTVTNVYDDAHRLTSRSIVRGPGVLGPTSETYTYDGLGRVKSAVDDDSAVNRVYDSLSRLVKDDINGRGVVSTYDGVGNLQRLIYPGTSAQREIVRTYDTTLGRLQSLKDAGSQIDLAAFSYIGAGRLDTLDMPLIGTRLTVGYDAVRRVASTDWTQNSGSVHLDQRAYTWDKSSNKMSRTNVLNSLVHTYTHDSADRMIASTRNGTSPQAIAYALDGVGNRLTVSGGSLPGSYTMNGADAPVNQYTTIPGQSREYDDNGNLEVLSGSKNLQLSYDYRNRMVQCFDSTTGFTHTYQYDAFGRRIGKVVDIGSANSKTTLYSYYGLNVIEEQDGGGVTQASYVWSGAMGGLLSMRRDGEDFYYLTDDLGNVMKLVDDSGTVVESYDYEDFGKPLDGNSLAPIAGSTLGNPYLFSSGEWDAETGLLKLGLRYLEPDSGRFTTRDPIGMWGDPLSFGNAYTYAGNNPWTFVDPTGTKACSRLSKADRRARWRRLARQLRKLFFGARRKGNTASHGNVTGNAPTRSTQGNTGPVAGSTQRVLAAEAAIQQAQQSTPNATTAGTTDDPTQGGTVNLNDRLSDAGITSFDWRAAANPIGMVDVDYAAKIETGSDAFFARLDADHADLDRRVEEYVANERWLMARDEAQALFTELRDRRDRENLRSTLALVATIIVGDVVSESFGPDTESTPDGPISMDEAVERGAEFTGPAGDVRETSGGMQFESVPQADGSRGVARFDVDPASPHVQRMGPHLNLETHVPDGRGGYDVYGAPGNHTPIDPGTVLPGDH